MRVCARVLCASAGTCAPIYEHTCALCVLAHMWVCGPTYCGCAGHPANAQGNWLQCRSGCGDSDPRFTFLICFLFTSIYGAPCPCWTLSWALRAQSRIRPPVPTCTQTMNRHPVWCPRASLQVPRPVKLCICLPGEQGAWLRLLLAQEVSDICLLGTATSPL